MNDSPTTRISLLVRLRDVSDEQAWAEFVDLYAPLVYRLARRHGLQDADAADLMQSVLGAAVGALPRFDYDPARGSFRGWLFTVARNLLHKLTLARQRQPQGSGDPETQARLSAEPAPEEADEWEREYQRRLFECAAQRVRERFRPTTWEAFWRSTIGGEDPERVGAELGLSVGAVYIARNRVLTRLKEQVRILESE